jgi:DNA-binding MarR family transcriptional regulator
MLAQMIVLREVSLAPGSSGAQLARSCFVTPQTAQALLKQLEGRGLIVRGKDRVNDRIVIAKVTPAGQRLLDRADRDALELQEELWKGASTAELNVLNELLARCLRNVDTGAAVESESAR